LSSLIAVVFAVASALMLGISAVADQRSTKLVQSRRALSPRILLDLVRQPLWVTALGANLVGFALQVAALSFGSLALVQPILVCDLIFAVLILWLLSRWSGIQRPGRTRQTRIAFAGVAATVVGVAGFLAIGRPSSGTTQVSFSVLLPLAVGIVVVVGGCLAVSARSRDLRPLALALACGINYGIAAFLVKLLTSEFGGGLSEVFTNWPIYVFAVVGPAGFLLSQDAFQQGTFLAPVQAIITAADPVISIALGILWLNVRLRSSPADIAGVVVSLLLIITGIVITATDAPAAVGPALNSHAGGSAGRRGRRPRFLTAATDYPERGRRRENRPPVSDRPNSMETQ
jgi:hypothetical protein